MAKQPEIKSTRFVLAEGYEDAEFTKAVIRSRQITNYEVVANVEIGEVGGDSGFEQAFRRCEALTGFPDVRDVVLIADNDVNANQKTVFRRVCAQLERARTEGYLKRNWGCVTQPCAKADGDPTVSVWMWPSPETDGCLETLIWRVILRRYPTDADCVDEALRCTKIIGPDPWPIGKRDKARVRSFLAMKCKENPAVHFGNVWRQFRDLIPLNDSEFRPFADFLRAV